MIQKRIHIFGIIILLMATTAIVAAQNPWPFQEYPTYPPACSCPFQHNLSYPPSCACPFPNPTPDPCSSPCPFPTPTPDPCSCTCPFGTCTGTRTSFSSSTITANFSANTTSGTAPLSVQFTDRSSGSPTSWNWDFGDGSQSLDKNPLHVFTSGGSYSVTLTISRIRSNGYVTSGIESKVTKNDYILVTGPQQTADNRQLQQANFSFTDSDRQRLNRYSINVTSLNRR